VLRLLRQIAGRLNRHSGPFVIHVSSIGVDVDRKFAAALIGMGLQHLDEKVLLVEIAGRAVEPAPLTSVSPSRGTARFIDPASGLLTMVVGIDEADENRAMIETIRDKAPADIDFVIVVGKALDARNDEPAADFSVVALPSEHDETAAATLLRGRVEGASLERTATLVIERSAGRRAMASQPAAPRSAAGKNA
jgi:hypothetical protein